MLLSEKTEALQEEVEELLKVPTDIPETYWPTVINKNNESKNWDILKFLTFLCKAPVIIINIECILYTLILSSEFRMFLGNEGFDYELWDFWKNRDILWATQTLCYGLDRFVAAQASSSTGLKAALRPAAVKQTFLRPAVGKQSFSDQLRVNSHSMNNDQS